MNIKDFLKAKFVYEFTDNQILAVMLERGIPVNAMFDQATEKQLDLAKADLYEIMFTLFSHGTNSIKRGNWARSVGGIIITEQDRLAFRESANFLYEKHGEEAKYLGRDRTNAW
jgi:hypothetical protein